MESYYYFSGERWFNYTMLSDIYNTFSKLTAEEHNLYYLYLLIKNNIRSELVQSNDKVGFSNFQRYERRKWYFSKDIDSQYYLARLAIRESLTASNNIQELEVRISPMDSAEGNCRLILGLERSILGERELTDWSSELPEERKTLVRLKKLGMQSPELLEYQEKALEQLELLQNRYYYVFHFTKRPDDELQRILNESLPEFHQTGYDMEYRHYSYRKHLEKLAMGIVEFRQQYSVLASRVRGIDACSQEIGCRPENFASVFRILGNNVEWRENFGTRDRLPQMRKTYHGGEDFLDIVDGLRAIDEAIRFLNLDCGDRLGHATALGIDAKEWYQSKGNQINLPIQDYLDNLAWLYHALQRYNIPDMELLQNYLEERFEDCFRTVYLNYMEEESLISIMKRAKEKYGNDERFRNYKIHRCNFDIKNYYRAWTLRGDHPQLYQEGFYFSGSIAIDKWERYQTNEFYPRKFDTRYIPECSLLYYYYHYNPGVKREGSRSITIHIEQYFVEGISAVQKAMQFDVAARGLSIETNPTSNVKIGTFRDYGKHPAITFLIRGLFMLPWDR